MYKSLVHGGFLLTAFLFHKLIGSYGDAQVELNASWKVGFPCLMELK